MPVPNEAGTEGAGWVPLANVCVLFSHGPASGVCSKLYRLTETLARQREWGCERVCART